MTHLRKLRLLKWVSSNFVASHTSNWFWPMGSLFYMGNNFRFCCTMSAVQVKRQTRHCLSESRKQAQAALFDYLHFTRNLQFRDAENMSKNSPYFLDKLLEKVDGGADVGFSVAQFLRYHPISEFELFYESLGLKPHEYKAIVPHNLTFLSDDDLLMKNYYVLFNYGIETQKMGRICVEATEVFWYSDGVLASKLHAYQELGLDQYFVTKLVVCSPYLLIGDVNEDFIKVLHIFRRGGSEISWIEQHLPENKSFNWSTFLALLSFFISNGYSEEQLGSLIRLQPQILFENSGRQALLLVGFLMKFGSTMNHIWSMFEEFPRIRPDKFISNLRRCFQTFTEIEMEVHEIGKLVRSHTVLLGSCNLKNNKTIAASLRVGKERLCTFIIENPHELKNLVYGSIILPLPTPEVRSSSAMQKAKFLMDLGLIDKSDDLEKAFRRFLGTGTEIQERFDCIVDAGLDRSVVSKMIKVAPGILKNSKKVIKMKIDFLVNDIGYPLSSLVAFPGYLNFSVLRVKLRVAMYNWLRDQGAIYPMGLGDLVRYSDKSFKQFVKHRHPRGLEVLEDLKKRIYSK